MGKTVVRTEGSTGAVSGRAVLAGDCRRRIRVRVRPGSSRARPHGAPGRHDRRADRAGIRQPPGDPRGRRLGLDRLVKTTVYLQDLDDFAGMNEVYSKHVGDQPPARATFEVALPPALVEIEAVALASS